MDPSYQMRRILAPVDGSDFSRHAAAYAVWVAQRQEAELILLQVVGPAAVAGVAQREADDGEDRARARLIGGAEAFLSHLARLADESHVPHRELVAVGDPATLICETAAREEADLIVMGRIGQHGARRILMGSITRRVIESTDRPVLVVTHRRERAATSDE